MFIQGTINNNILPTMNGMFKIFVASYVTMVAAECNSATKNVMSIYSNDCLAVLGCSGAKTLTVNQLNKWCKTTSCIELTKLPYNDPKCYTNAKLQTKLINQAVQFCNLTTQSPFCTPSPTPTNSPEPSPTPTETPSPSPTQCFLRQA